MKSVPLSAYTRTTKGRAGVKKLREGGRLPAVIYGDGNEGVSLEVNTREFQHIINHSVSENLLVDLSIEGDANKRLVLLQEVQHNNLTGDVLHIDFHEVAEEHQVSITIPIETKGEAKGVKAGGGTLEQVLFRIKVEALPRDLPEFLQLDVTELGVGESIHVKDIPPHEGVKFLADGHLTVCSIAAPRVEKSAEEGGEAGGVKESK